MSRGWDLAARTSVGRHVYGFETELDGRFPGGLQGRASYSYTDDQNALTTQSLTNSVALASLDYANVFIGEDSAFLRAGGMINLVLDKGKVRFEIAHDAIERSNIHFSSKFLSLAKANYESYN